MNFVHLEIRLVIFEHIKHRKPYNLKSSIRQEGE